MWVLHLPVVKRKRFCIYTVVERMPGRCVQTGRILLSTLHPQVPREQEETTAAHWGLQLLSEETTSIQYNGHIQYNTIQYNTIQWTIQYNTIQYNTIQYNTIQMIRPMIQCDTIRYDTIRYDTIRYDTIRYDTIRYDTIRYDTIRYDAMRYDNLNSCGKNSH